MRRLSLSLNVPVPVPQQVLPPRTVPRLREHRLSQTNDSSKTGKDYFKNFYFTIKKMLILPLQQGSVTGRIFKKYIYH